MYENKYNRISDPKGGYSSLSHDLRSVGAQQIISRTLSVSDIRCEAHHTLRIVINDRI